MGSTTRAASCVLALALLGAGAAGAVEPPPTLRVDYYHSGNALLELFSLHQVVIEPLPWAGNPRQPVDETNRGKYYFEVSEPVTGEVFYSRGFSSIFGEWETTAEAKQINRSFHESVRFPKPAHPVRLRLMKRDSQGEFATVWSIDIDPDDMLVVRTPRPREAPLIEIETHGAPQHKVDLLVLGDGYTEDDGERFLEDVRRLTEALFDVSPFRERREDFNVWAMMPASPETGVARPSSGSYRWSPLGTRYDAFRSERYVLTFDNLAFREIAAHAPYDFVEILVNNETYGGGGIFGLYSTAAAGSEWAPYLFIHEFGHHFAALADEYYTSPVAYESSDERPEPWEPNVTALHDSATLKWRRFVTPGTPLPTAWPKERYESYARDYQERRARLREQNRPEAEMNALFREYQAFVEQLFAGQPHSDAIGAFEGANYEATGYYRPEMNCLMFTRHTRFCRICQAGIEAMIDLYSR